MMVAILEYEPGLTADVADLGLLRGFVSFLSLDHPNNNVHNLRLCRMMVGTKAVPLNELLGEGSWRRPSVLSYTCENLGAFMEPSLSFASHHRESGKEEGGRPRGPGEHLHAEDRELGAHWTWGSRSWLGSARPCCNSVGGTLKPLEQNGGTQPTYTKNTKACPSFPYFFPFRWTCRWPWLEAGPPPKYCFFRENAKLSKMSSSSTTCWAKCLATADTSSSLLSGAVQLKTLRYFFSVSTSNLTGRPSAGFSWTSETRQVFLLWNEPRAGWERRNISISSTTVEELIKASHLLAVVVVVAVRHGLGRERSSRAHARLSTRLAPWEDGAPGMGSEPPGGRVARAGSDRRSGRSQPSLRDGAFGSGVQNESKRDDGSEAALPCPLAAPRNSQPRSPVDRFSPLSWIFGKVLQTFPKRGSSRGAQPHREAHHRMMPIAIMPCGAAGTTTTVGSGAPAHRRGRSGWIPRPPSQGRRRPAAVKTERRRSSRHLVRSLDLEPLDVDGWGETTLREAQEATGAVFDAGTTVPTRFEGEEVVSEADLLSQDRCVFCDLSDASVLQVRGEHRLAFLHNQSTASVEGVETGRVRNRLRDGEGGDDRRASSRAEAVCVVLASAGGAASLAAHLEKRSSQETTSSSRTFPRTSRSSSSAPGAPRSWRGLGLPRLGQTDRSL